MRAQISIPFCFPKIYLSTSLPTYLPIHPSKHTPTSQAKKFQNPKSKMQTHIHTYLLCLPFYFLTFPSTRSIRTYTLTHVYKPHTYTLLPNRHKKRGEHPQTD